MQHFHYRYTISINQTTALTSQNFTVLRLTKLSDQTRLRSLAMHFIRTQETSWYYFQGNVLKYWIFREISCSFSRLVLLLFSWNETETNCVLQGFILSYLLPSGILFPPDFCIAIKLIIKLDGRHIWMYTHKPMPINKMLTLSLFRGLLCNPNYTRFW